MKRARAFCMYCHGPAAECDPRRCWSEKAKNDHASVAAYRADVLGGRQRKVRRDSAAARDAVTDRQRDIVRLKAARRLARILGVA